VCLLKISSKSSLEEFGRITDEVFVGYKFLPFVADKYGDQLVPKVGRFLIRFIALYDKCWNNQDLRLKRYYCRENDFRCNGLRFSSHGFSNVTDRAGTMC
jgi:hypothetical protein